jgi:hypothetical protein
VGRVHGEFPVSIFAQFVTSKKMAAHARQLTRRGLPQLFGSLFGWTLQHSRPSTLQARSAAYLLGEKQVCAHGERLRVPHLDIESLNRRQSGGARARLRVRIGQDLQHAPLADKQVRKVP